MKAREGLWPLKVLAANCGSAALKFRLSETPSEPETSGPEERPAYSTLAGRHAIYLAERLGAELFVLYAVDAARAFHLGMHSGEAVVELERFGKEATARVRWPRRAACGASSAWSAGGRIARSSRHRRR